jgi:hypothetical protein
LKAQLQQALKRVEAREEAAAKKMQPRSLEEIEMLEEKLSKALNKLGRQKKALHAKATTTTAADAHKTHKKLQEARGHLNEPSFSRRNSDYGGSRGRYGGGGSLLYDAVYLALNEEKKNQKGEKKS